MALPEPPPNIPRIVEVQDPGTGHYVVMVRMPTQLAAKFPDKPWGTEIDTIGLAKQDSDRFPGYTLVDVEPLKGSPDLYWIFQKLDGPVWTTKSKGQESLVPAKYRRLVTTTRTKQEVTPDTLPSNIEAPIKSSVVEQQDDTGKAVKVNTEEVIDVDGDPIVGQQFDPGGAIIDVSENVVSEGTAADAAFLVAGSTVDAFGDGDAAKVTQTPRKRVVDGDGESTETGWPKKQVKTVGVENLTPQKYRGQTVTKTTVEQVALTVGQVDDIPAPALTVPRNDETTIKHEKVNDWRYQREVTEEIIDENADPLLGKQLVEYGIADTSERVVLDNYVLTESGANPDVGIKTLSLSKDPFGNGKSVLNTVKIDSFPVLYGTEILAPYNIPVTVEKQVVPAGTPGSVNGNTIIEVRPQDKWRSIQITSVIGAGGALPTTETIIRDIRYKFDDVLLSIDLVFAGPLLRSFDPNLHSLIPQYNLKKGASGSFKGKILRSFHVGAPVDNEVIWQPLPTGDSFIYNVTYFRWAGQVSYSKVQSGVGSVPVSLHSQLNVVKISANSGYDYRGSYLRDVRFASSKSNYLPATNFTSLPAIGSNMLVDRHSERIRGNVWVLEKTYLTMQ